MPKALKKPHRGITPGKIGSFKDARHSWQLQSAKAQLSEVFRQARNVGPQLITRRGKEGVIMISVEQFDQLVVGCHRPESIVRFFRESPLVEVSLDLERDRSNR